jgi:hypothetical protein
MSFAKNLKYAAMEAFMTYDLLLQPDEKQPPSAQANHRSVKPFSNAGVPLLSSNA